MKNILLTILVVAVLLVGGFYVLNGYIYNEKQGDGETATLTDYFREQMWALGVADIGQPIEGFDANLLIMAFPGLIPGDFEGVETFEGTYDVNGEEIVFVRGVDQPITSAERTVSNEGYITLLEKVSARLSLPATTESEVDELIKRINTDEN